MNGNKRNFGGNDKGLCFHDWLIVRELKGLDKAYDNICYAINSRILGLYDIEDSDERQRLYDDMLVERERMRAIYIQRRNELKSGFTDKRKEESEVEDGKAFRVFSGGSRWSKEVGEELFGKKNFIPYVKGNSEAFSDPLIADDLVGEALPEITDGNGDMVKEARGFIFNEHPEAKEKVSDGLEEFLRRTLKEDE